MVKMKIKHKEINKTPNIHKLICLTLSFLLSLSSVPTVHAAELLSVTGSTQPVKAAGETTVAQTSSASSFQDPNNPLSAPTSGSDSQTQIAAASLSATTTSRTQQYHNNWVYPDFSPEASDLVGAIIANDAARQAFNALYHVYLPPQGNNSTISDSDNSMNSFVTQLGYNKDVFVASLVPAQSFVYAGMASPATKDAFNTLYNESFTSSYQKVSASTLLELIKIVKDPGYNQTAFFAKMTIVSSLYVTARGMRDNSGTNNAARNFFDTVFGTSLPWPNYQTGYTGVGLSAANRDKLFAVYESFKTTDLTSVTSVLGFVSMVMKMDAMLTVMKTDPARGPSYFGITSINLSGSLSTADQIVLAGAVKVFMNKYNKLYAALMLDPAAIKSFKVLFGYDFGSPFQNLWGERKLFEQRIKVGYVQAEFLQNLKRAYEYYKAPDTKVGLLEGIFPGAYVSSTSSILSEYGVDTLMKIVSRPTYSVANINKAMDFAYSMNNYLKTPANSSYGSALDLIYGVTSATRGMVYFELADMNNPTVLNLPLYTVGAYLIKVFDIVNALRKDAGLRFAFNSSSKYSGAIIPATGRPDANTMRILFGIVAPTTFNVSTFLASLKPPLMS